MDDYKFNVLSRRGDAGVAFFRERQSELLDHPLILSRNLDDWHVEGADIIGVRQIWTPSTFVDETGKEKLGLVPHAEFGGVEIKTLGADQFLPRFGVNDLPCGTIGYPLWSKTMDMINGGTQYTRDCYGNLKRWMEPSVEDRSSRPLCMIHFLETIEMDDQTGQEKARYFAAIAFEDVPKLLARLTEYLKPFGLDLDDWDTIPVGQEARTLRIDGLFLQGNMVQVPLSVLSDLATVTMIGDEPEIYETGRCSAKVQHARLEYLKELANGRWIPLQRTEAEDDVLSQWYQWYLGQFSAGLNQLTLLDRKGNPMSP